MRVSQKDILLPEQEAPFCLPDREIPILHDITITEDEVFNQLQALHVNKSCGPDGVPNTIIQMIATFLKEPLTKIFNKSRGEISVSLEAC